MVNDLYSELLSVLPAVVMISFVQPEEGVEESEAMAFSSVLFLETLRSSEDGGESF